MVLNHITSDLFRLHLYRLVERRDLCVCVPLPLHVHIYVPWSEFDIYVCFYARVGVWMSVCLSLCCHICCYQGNPVGRQRSAERCTAWRRETCGAQPVAGKKPVRDSPTNPVPPPVRPWDELFLTRSDSCRRTLPLRRRTGRFLHHGALSAASSSPAGGSPSLFFRFQTQRENKTGG